MMTKTGRGACLAVAMALAQPVAAQDWAGPYLGLSVGQATGSATLTSDGATSPFGTADLSGSVVAITAGHAWQLGDWVLGAELSAGTAGASGRFTHPSGSAMRYEDQAMATAGLRVGYAFDRVLLSATAGWAAIRTDFSFDTAPPVRSLTFEDDLRGHYVGLSVDLALDAGWAVRAEARRYAGLSARNPAATFPGGPPVITLSAATRDYDRSEVRLSVLRRF
ncbi:outer membrane protein [Roseicyclus persicicus]|uniref:Porin family protein n=1 Tax=Roseicyclus persicicus TaxID=2650661 RepID=A0A7X6H029_9RHOB|nr:outer membrane beta-barrel protein [Roseibacterium persicicum]NKX44411.1 porin family protein [Roseibacterium persicicum]